MLKGKKVTAGDQTLEMTASERIATYVQKNVLEMGEGTSSVKVVNKIMKGSQAIDSHLEFVMRVLGQLRSESNGSFSINLPSSLDEEQTKKLAQAVANVHGHLEMILNTVHNMLPEDQKAVGKEIQRQNVIRQIMIGSLTNVSDAPDRVEHYLKTNGLLIIPAGAHMELKIVGGSLTFEKPVGQYWKEGPDIKINKSAHPTWRANWDLYGRTRLPLVNEQISEYALKSVFGLASSFEEYWKGVIITSSAMILDGFLEWSEKLEGKNTDILRNTLSEEEMAELEKIAKGYVNEMMSW